jgi:ferredoxin
MDSRQQKCYSELVEIANDRGYKLTSLMYENANVKLSFQCTVGHVFEMRARNFKRGQNCPKCVGSCPIQAKDRFLHLASDRQYQIVGTYINTQTKLDLVCSKQHVFSITPHNFSSGHGCPRCANVCPQQAKERFLLQASERQFEVRGLYINDRTKVEMWCKNGHSFNITPTDYMSGNGCSRCSGVCPIQAQKNFIKRISENNHCLLDNYINNRTKVHIRCGKSHVFSIAPTDYMRGNRCSVCNESSGEQLIRTVLDYLRIPFKKDHIFEFLPKRKYDFAFMINTTVVVIEWDGLQHFEFTSHFHDNEKEFEERQEIDILKTQTLLNHRYKIIRIDHTWLHKTLFYLAAFIHQAILDPYLLIVSNTDMYGWLRSKVTIRPMIRLKIRTSCH